jgi:hypothetical protein
LIYLPRVALEIKDVGLYDRILQDVQKIIGREKVTQDEVLEVLKNHPEILNEYKQLNVEYNLSNIHIKEIPTENLTGECLELAKKFNSNLEKLKELEPYTLDFEQSSTLVIIFSVEFFVLFSVQYFIVLLNLKEWQWYIYATFAMSVLIAWLYAKREKRKFEVNNTKFEKIYSESLELLEKLESKKCVKKEDLIIKSSDEHV